MNKLTDVIAYICSIYPNNQDLSKARLTKLVYLADWASALNDSQQLTDIKWLFNHFGPYVDDIEIAAKNSPYFKIEISENYFGSKKTIIQLNPDTKSKQIAEHLTHRDKQIIDLVIEKTHKMYFNEFINYVYASYPVSSKTRYSTLNLIGLAQEYRQIRAKQG